MSSRKAYRLVGISLLLVATLAACEAMAEVADPGELETLQEKIDKSAGRQEKLSAEADAARKEAEAIRARLIDTAARVQAREADVSASEGRLSGLTAAEEVVTARLAHRRGEMADLLAALTRLDPNPPPAMAVSPDDALTALRSALLLGKAVPELQAEAKDLANRLEELARLRKEILAERQNMTAARGALDAERSKLEKLLAEKEAVSKKLSAEARSEQQKVAALSQQATDLKDLINRLEANAASRLPAIRPEPVRPEPVPAPSAQPEPAAPSPPQAAPTEKTRLAVLTPPKTPPAMPSSRRFSEAKGLIRPPVTGTILRGFGADNGLGGKLQGMTIATRYEAQVIAPFDGKIVFAGPFRGYGQLLIISVGEGYHVLLAGMARIDGQTGQQVLAGEPLGEMGQTGNIASQTSQAGGSAMSKSGPTLYIEFRKDGDPVDPRPWLLMSDKKARG